MQHILTSSQIRQSFLDFFKSKQHTLVPSSSLMPDSPNLLFTNAGMNQFVPIFLGQTKCPYTPGRAADTQKCIRAGGKHNDLEDVGLDTYHHTFFEMLGNWSFGDYFKKEAIEWAWELVVEIWKFPPSRLYATVYSPDKSKNDPSEFDQEAWNFWAEKFRSVGLDPKIHIVNGNKKDNFWMMGETGPCGPCSELHVDLTPNGDTQGKLVNASSPQCIEIWNLVFIQFNANPDGTFSPLPARHVDTGMGFERVTSIIQGTKGLKDFKNAKISNYETDIFRPIFDKLEQLSGKRYTSTLPGSIPQGSGNVPLSQRDVPLSSRDVPTSSRDVPQTLGNVPRASGDAPEAQRDIPQTSGNVPEASRNVPQTSGNIPASSRDVPQTSGDAQKSQNSEQIALDIAFRVIADHIRTLSFAIADGIQPGNTDRNYVLRRILRRAVRYGRTLGFHEPFFYKLVDVLADTMGDVFPEIRAKKKHVQEVIRVEEEAFNKTLDTGIELFEKLVSAHEAYKNAAKEMEPHLWSFENALKQVRQGKDVEDVVRNISQKEINWIASAALSVSRLKSEGLPWEFIELRTAPPNIEDARASLSAEKGISEDQRNDLLELMESEIGGLLTAVSNVGYMKNKFSAESAFVLYDTYGFPLDLTELMARERGLTVDKEGFEKLMEEQRARARAAQKKEVISLSQIETTVPTKFVGYENLETPAKVLEVVSLKNKTAVVLDTSPCYAEMGGQVGDTGEIFPVAADVSRLKLSDRADSRPLLRITNTQKSGNTWLHFVDGDNIPAIGNEVLLRVDQSRRNSIQRHHTVTHLLHWALHEVVSKDASQKGSFVGPDKLTFDFNSQPLTPQQVADVEKLVNERILENAGVSWTEVPYTDVKSRKDVMQFFGEKYGDTVRVVQIGGHAAKLDGYSMELCGGTHTRATGEIGLFRIVGESAIAAGVRRVEAVAGLEAYRKATDEVALIKSLAGKVNSPIHELDKKIEAMLVHQKDLEKLVKAAQQREASNAASLLLEEVKTVNGIPVIIHNLGVADGDFLQAIADSLKGRFKGVIILGGAAGGAVSLLAAVSPDFSHDVQAGKIIQQIAPIVGGRGGGKPDNARGGGKDAAKLDEALAKAKSLLG